MRSKLYINQFRVTIAWRIEVLPKIRLVSSDGCDMVFLRVRFSTLCIQFVPVRVPCDCRKNVHMLMTVILLSWNVYLSRPCFLESPYHSFPDLIPASNIEFPLSRRWLVAALLVAAHHQAHPRLLCDLCNFGIQPVIFKVCVGVCESERASERKREREMCVWESMNQTP